MFRRKKEETMIPWGMKDKNNSPVATESGEESSDLSAEAGKTEQEVPVDKESVGELEQEVPADQEGSVGALEQEVPSNQQDSVTDSGGVSAISAAGAALSTPAALAWARAKAKASSGGSDVSADQFESDMTPGDIAGTMGQKPDKGDDFLGGFGSGGDDSSGGIGSGGDDPSGGNGSGGDNLSGGNGSGGDNSSGGSGPKDDESPYSDYYSEDENDDEDDIEEEYYKKKTRGPVFIWGRRILLTIVCFFLALFMTFIYSLWSEYSGSRVYSGNDIRVEIPKGATPQRAAEILQDAGAIRYAVVFRVKLLAKGENDNLKYGTYQISEGDNIDDIIEKLTTGGEVADESKFMVPEGYSIEMIADKLDQGNIISGKEFLKAVDEAQENFVYKDKLPAADKVNYPMQGYLFPDTYHIDENTTAVQLVNKMLANYEKVFDESRQKKAKKLGMSMEEVLTRASLVQKESYNEDDYAAIAGVINNRLDKGMKLQFDSTVVYAISDGKYGVDRVMEKDLEVDSPYNTYKIKGLPPGPICNPGLKAIDAVLNPEKHDYLYFRTDPSKDDGSNIFTKTYEEHMAVGDGTAADEDTKEDKSEKKDNTTKEDKSEKKDNTTKEDKSEKKDNTTKEDKSEKKDNTTKEDKSAD